MGGISLFIILLGPVTVLASIRNRNDENACSTYGIINASIRMYWKPGGTLCDNELAEGWQKLRTEDGRPAKIPQLCIQNNFGGTRLPMHMDLGGQDLPDVNVTLEAHVCTSFSVLGKLDCCVLRQEAAVRNCGDFYVYYLKPVDRCPVAYVAQEIDQNIQSQFTAKTGDEAVQQRSTNTSATSQPAAATSETLPTSSVIATTTTDSVTATTASLPDDNPSISLRCPSDRQRSPCHRGSDRWCYRQAGGPRNFGGERLPGRGRMRGSGNERAQVPGDNGPEAGADGQSVMIECVNGSGCGIMCDGMPDCEDESDESPDLCVRPVCSEGTQRCPDGTPVCYTRCDGNQQCRDGSDEENCSQGEDAGESVTNSTNGTTSPSEMTTAQISTEESPETTISISTSVSTPVFEDPTASLDAQTNITTSTTQPPATLIADISSTTAEQSSSAGNISTSLTSATTITSNVSVDGENASSVVPERTTLVHPQTSQIADNDSFSSATIDNDSQHTEISESTNATVSEVPITSTVEVTTLSAGNDTSTPNRTTVANESSSTSSPPQTTIQTSTTTPEHIYTETTTALPTGTSSAEPSSAEQEVSSGSTRSTTVLTSTSISAQTPAQTSVATPTDTTRVTTTVLPTSTDTAYVVSTQSPATTTTSHKPTLAETSRAASSPPTSGTPDIPSTSPTQRSTTTLPRPLTVVTTTRSTTVSESRTTTRSSSPSTTTPSPPAITTRAPTTTKMPPPIIPPTTTPSTVSRTTQSIPATQSTIQTHEHTHGHRSSSPTTSTPIVVSKSSTFMGISASESTSNTTSNTTESTLLVDDDSHGGLFGYNPGLFIFLIAAGIVIFCVTIFGIVGLVYYRRLRSWSPEMSFQDAYAEPEKTIPPPMREKNGIESPIPDVGILRGEEDSPSKASTLVCGPTPDRLRTMNETIASSPDTSGQNGFQTPPVKPAAVYAEIGTGQVNGGFFGGDGGDGDGVVPIDELDQLSPRIMFPWIESAEDTKL